MMRVIIVQMNCMLHFFASICRVFVEIWQTSIWTVKSCCPNSIKTHQKPVAQWRCTEYGKNAYNCTQYRMCHMDVQHVSMWLTKLMLFFVRCMEEPLLCQWSPITQTFMDLNDLMVYYCKMYSTWTTIRMCGEVEWSEESFCETEWCHTTTMLWTTHKIFTQIDSQIENQFHFHKTIFICVHSHLSLCAEWNLQPQRHTLTSMHVCMRSQERAAFDDYSQWQHTVLVAISKETNIYNRTNDANDATTTTIRFKQATHKHKYFVRSAPIHPVCNICFTFSSTTHR